MSKSSLDSFVTNNKVKSIIGYCIGILLSLVLLFVGVVTIVQNSKTTNVFCTVVSTDDGNYYNVLNGGRVYWDNANVGLCLGENFRVGKTTTLSAKPNNGYSFVGYYTSMDANAQILSTNQDYTFAVDENTSQIYAKFAKNVDVTFTLTDPNNENLTYTFTETFYVGQEVKITDILSSNSQVPEEIIQYYENSTPSTMQSLVSGTGFAFAKNSFVVGIENTSLAIQPSAPSFVGAWLDQLGTELDPYLIESSSDLESFANAVNSGNSFENIYLKLTNDITISNFTSIGNVIATSASSTTTYSFKGTFDGDNHTITIQSFATRSSIISYFGLFGYNAGTIKNVKVSGVIAGTVTKESGDTNNYAVYVGGIAGYNTGTVYNCSVNSIIDSNNTTAISSSQNYVGGVVGVNEGVINKCYIYDVSSPSTPTSISGTASTGVAIGGIVGANLEDGQIYNCFNTATISGSGYEWVGGIAGINHGKIANCFNQGAISGKAYVGGIAGQNCTNTNNSYGTIVNTYNSGNVSGTSANAGGVVGYNDSSSNDSMLYNYYKSDCVTTTGTAYVHSSTVAFTINNNVATLATNVTVGNNSATNSLLTALQDGQTYLALNNTTVEFVEWDTVTSSYFGNNPTLFTTTFNVPEAPSYAFGSGSEVDPWGISTEAQLTAFFATATNANKSAILCNNIALTSAHAINVVGTISNPYTGVFNGNGFTISGVTCGSNSTDYVGFVGYNAGTIKNLSIETTGSGVVGLDYVGGIAGYNTGTISEVSFSGAVVGYGNFVGGIVGANKGTVDRATNKASVTGSNSSNAVGLGGIAGINLSDSGNAVIKNCYNDGFTSNYANDVTGTNYQWVGGIAGQNTGYIYNSYNNMDISGSIFVGGIAGQSSGSITNTYNRGSVSASSTYSGGIVGQNTGTLVDNYYLDDCATDGNTTPTAQNGVGNATLGETTDDVVVANTPWTASGKYSGTSDTPSVTTWNETTKTIAYTAFTGYTWVTFEANPTENSIRYIIIGAGSANSQYKPSSTDQPNLPENAFASSDELEYDEIILFKEKTADINALYEPTTSNGGTNKACWGADGITDSVSNVTSTIKTNLNTTSSSIFAKLGLTENLYNAHIVTKTMKTAWHSYPVVEEAVGSKVFLLATTEYCTSTINNTNYSSQNFCVQTYLGSLSSNTKYKFACDGSNGNSSWWLLRSGYIDGDGRVSLAGQNSVNKAYSSSAWGVRPAFVLKVTKALTAPFESDENDDLFANLDAWQKANSNYMPWVETGNDGWSALKNYSLTITASANGHGTLSAGNGWTLEDGNLTKNIGTGFSIVSLPNPPTADSHFTFKGWYRHSTAEDSPLTDLSTFNANTTIYAHYTGDLYDVSSESSANYGTLTVAEQGEMGKPLSISVSSPSITGVTFDSCTITVRALTVNGTVLETINSSSGTYTMNGTYYSSIFITAVWNLSYNTYSITYALNGGTHGTTHPNSATYGTTFEVSAPTQTGYTFTGWTVSSGLDTSTAKWGTSSPAGTALSSASTKCINGTNSVYFLNLTPTASGSVTLTANWTVNTYTVTLDQQSGTGGTSSVTATFGSAMPSATMPTRTGYTFNGYFTQQNGCGTKYYNANGSSAHVWDIAQNKTLYAYWTANTYTVTFDANNGTTPSSTSKTVTYGSAYGTLPTTSRTGYTFDGWYTSTFALSSIRYIKDTVNGSNKNAGSHWVEVKAFDANNTNWATTANGASATWTNASGATTSKSMLIDGNISSWLEGGNGKAFVIVDLGQLRAITSITVWHYYSDSRIYNNAKTEVSADGVTWYTIFDSDVSGTYTETSSGHTMNVPQTCELITSSTIVSTAENHALYAHWAANTYSVTFNANGGTTPSPTSKQVAYGSAYGTLATTTKTGYTFDGWYKDSGIGTGYTQVSYIESNGTQYIDTGVSHDTSGSSKLSMKLEYTSLSANNQIMGYTGNAGSGIGTNNKTAWWEGPSGTVTTGTIYNLVYEKQGSSWSKNVNGTIATGTRGNNLYTTNLYLFATKSGASATYYCSCKFYGACIWKNGTLVRNYIPAVRDSDSVAGLYDKINGVFYPSNSATNFTAGGEVLPISSIRYIKDTVNGSSVNNGSHWVQVQALDEDNTNWATSANGASVKMTNASGTVSTITRPIDGNTGSSGYADGGKGKAFIVVDLGQLRDIFSIIVWHYYSDGRTYNNAKTEVSADGVTWYTIFDSDVSGTYAETSSGHTMRFVMSMPSEEITSSTIVLNTENHTLYAHWTVNSYKVTFNANGGTIDNTSFGTTWTASGTYISTGTAWTYDSTNHTIVYPNNAFDGYTWVTFDTPTSTASEWTRWIIIGGGSETYKPTSTTCAIPSGAFGTNGVGQTDGLSANQVLLLSEQLLCVSKFFSSTTTTRYSSTGNVASGNGLLATYNTIVQNYGLSGLLIEPQDLVTYYNGCTENDVLKNQYVFPLATSHVKNTGYFHSISDTGEPELASQQNFNIESYFGYGSSYTSTLGNKYKAWFKDSNSTYNDWRSYWMRSGSSTSTSYAKHMTKIPTLISYSVTDSAGVRPAFVLNLGSMKSVTYDSAYGTLPNAEQTGYTLDGWYTAQTGGTKVTASTIVTTANDHTLWAHWTGNEYTVTFDKQSGTGGTASVTATFGSAMPSATMPTRTGYTFNGYFAQTGGGGTKYYNADGTSAHAWDVASNTTIYAHWTANTYNIILDGNGGEAATPWTASGVYTNESSNAYPTVVGNNVSYPAFEGYKWVSFDNGTTRWIIIGSGSTAASTLSLTTDKGTQNRSNEIGSSQILLLSEKILTAAQFNASDSNGNNYEIGSGTDGISNLKAVINGMCSSYGLSRIPRSAIATPTLTNAYHNGSSVTTSTTELTITNFLFPLASRYGTSWQANSYTDTYGAQNFWVETYLNGGTGTYYNGTYEKMKAYSGTSTSTSNWWLRSGYHNLSYVPYNVHFGGDVDYSNLRYSFGVRPAFVLNVPDTIAGLIVANNGLTATKTMTYDTAGQVTNPFEKSFDITYNANSGSVTTTDANTKATATFNGWRSSVASGTYGTTSACGTAITTTDNIPNNSYVLNVATSGSVTFTAQWTDGSVTLPTPTRTGYTFGGWYTDSACTTANKVGDGGATYTPDQSRTLYAKWTANEYTITLDQQSGTGGTASVTATFGSAMPSATMPTRTGYTFQGYFAQTGGGGTKYYNADGTSAHAWDVASNTTIYAHWTGNTYNIILDGNGGVATASMPWTASGVYTNESSNAYPTVVGNNVSYPAFEGYKWVSFDNGTTRWIIIGSTDAAASQLGLTTSTGKINGTYYDTASGTNKNDLSGSQILLLSEKILTTSSFNNPYTNGNNYASTSTSSTNTTPASLLQQKMAEIYADANGTYGITSTLKSHIQTVDLTNAYCNSSITTSISSSQTFFALSSRYGWDNQCSSYTSTYGAQKYNVETYLNGGLYTSNNSNYEKMKAYEGTSTSASDWWLRSGGSNDSPYAYRAAANGCVYTYSVNTSYGVRPAFVLNLNPATVTQKMTYDTAGQVTNPFTKSFEVTYNANSGSVTTTDANTKATATFNGWRSSVAAGTYGATSACGTAITTTDNIPDNSYVLNVATSGSVTFTAQWTSGSVTLPTPTRTGYTFGGWYTDSACTTANKVGDGGATYTPDQSRTLYAKWTGNEYTVTLDQQSGTGGSASVTATFGSAMPSATMPTRTGYTFQGYFAQTGGGGTKYYNADGTSAHAWDIANDTSIYADWTINSYEVTFNANGGTIVTGQGTPWTASGTYISTGTAWTYNSTNHTIVYPNSAFDGYTWVTFDTPTSTASEWTRWIIIGGGSETYKPTTTTYAIPSGAFGTNGVGQTDSLSASQVLLLSEQCLCLSQFDSSGDISQYSLTGNVSSGSGLLATYNTILQNYGLSNWFIASQDLVTYYKGSTENDVLENQYMFPLATSHVQNFGYFASISDTGEPELASQQNFNIESYFGYGNSYASELSDKYKAWFKDSNSAYNDWHSYWTRSGSNTYSYCSKQIKNTAQLISYIVSDIAGVRPAFVLDLGPVETTTKTVTYGSAYGEIPNAEKTGYTFDGWYTAQTGGTKVTASTIVTTPNDHTLWAHWTANEYTITLDQQSGTGGTASVTATFDSAMPSATMPTRTGYTFQGYFAQTGGAGTKYYNADGTSAHVWDIAQNTTIYAYWTDTTAPATPTITRTDYNTFTYSSSDDGSGLAGYYVSTNSTAPTASSTWLATTETSYDISTAGTYYVWAKDVAGNISDSASITAYTVTRNQGENSTLTTKYDSTSSSTGTEFTSATFVVLSGTSVWASAEASTGYTATLSFGSTSQTASGASTTITADLTISSTATVNTYTITFNGNGNTSGSTADKVMTYDTAEQITSNGFVKAYVVTYNPNSGTMTTTDANTKANFTFDGWRSSVASGTYGTTSACGTAITTTDNIPNNSYVLNVATSGSVTFTAQWTGGSVTLPTPTLSGHTFLGWYSDQACTDNKVGDGGDTYTPDQSRTLYAKWELSSVKITLNANQGTCATSEVTINFGESIFSTTIATATRQGYTFGGWTITQNGSDYLINTSGELIGSVEGYTTTSGTWKYESDITLYAKWTANTYTISYVLNSGTEGSNSPISGTYDEALTISNPTKAGYTFDGWTITGMDSCTHTYGSSTTTATSLSACKETNYMNLRATSGTVTFTATWTANTNTAYTVNHYFQKLGATYNTSQLSNFDLIPEILYGVTDAKVTPEYMEHTGFTAYGKTEITILGDGSASVDYFYQRGSLTLTLQAYQKTQIEEFTGAGSYEYGASVTVTAKIKSGYTWLGWIKSVNYALTDWAEETLADGVTHKATFKMPAESITLSASAQNTTVPTKLKIAVNPTTMTATIIKYEGEETSLILPEVVGIGDNDYAVVGNTYVVTKIATDAFVGNTLTSLTIPETITEFAENAFSSCSSLSVIKIDGTSLTIGHQAFSSSTNASNYSKTIFISDTTILENIVGSELYATNPNGSYGNMLVNVGCLAISKEVYEQKPTLNKYISDHYSIVQDGGKDKLYTDATTGKQYYLLLRSEGSVPSGVFQ